jgi:hypothetical protein
MRTALNLLNEINAMGFDQQNTLKRMDKILDKKLGIEGRKPLFDETLTEGMYDDILGIFVREAEEK